MTIYCVGRDWLRPLRASNNFCSFVGFDFKMHWEDNRLASLISNIIFQNTKQWLYSDYCVSVLIIHFFSLFLDLEFLYRNLMWVQVLCLRLVEGRALDLQLRDERLFAWLRMASLLFLVSLFWVRLFPRENYVKRCAKPKYIMSSINCMKLIIREKIIPLPVN